MSIAKRVSEAIDKMEASDAEGALFAICAAIDATSKLEFGKGGRGSYKDFIAQNLALITDIGLGGRRILNINLAYDHPGIKRNADGSCSIQEVLYHAVRCGLYHEAALPENLKFSKECRIEFKEGALALPASLVYGFIVAVIVAPANQNEVESKPATFNIGNFQIPISRLWGRRNELLWLLDTQNELARQFTDTRAQQNAG